MKKILFIVSVVAVAAFGFSPGSSGSRFDPSIQLRTDAWHGPARKSLQVGLVNAAKNFTKDHPDALSSAWDRFKDGSLLCHYQTGGKAGRAYYSAHGGWKLTIEDYAGRFLPVSVKADIRSVFGRGTELRFVNEIIVAGRLPYYLVLIKSGPLVQRVRADEEGMEVLETFTPDPADLKSED